MKHRFTRAVFTILLLIAAYAVSADKFNVSAQSCDFPGLSPWYGIFYDSWEPNANVHVFVDESFNETDRAQLEQGIRNWNLYTSLDCSGVEFYGFETMSFSGIPTAQMPPDYTVWVVRENCTAIPQIDSNGNPVYDSNGNRVYVIPAACGQRRAGGQFPFERVRAQKIRVSLATVNIPSIAVFSYVGSHETGHAFALDHPKTINSVMSGPHDNALWNASLPTLCDVVVVAVLYCCTPTACPEDFTWDYFLCSCQPDRNTQGGCEVAGMYWNFMTNTCQSDPPPPCDLEPEVCNTGYTWSFAECQCVLTGSPIVVDVGGDGFNLTSAADGVDFDLNSDGRREKVSWTSAGSMTPGLCLTETATE